MSARHKSSPPNLLTLGVCLAIVFGGLFFLDVVASPIGLVGVVLASLVSALVLISQARRRQMGIDAKSVAASYALVSAIFAIGFAIAVILRFGSDTMMFYFAGIGVLLTICLTWLTATLTLKALSRAPQSLEGIS